MSRQLLATVAVIAGAAGATSVSAYDYGSPQYRLVVAMTAFQKVEDCAAAGQTMTQADVDAVATFVRRVVEETGLSPEERDGIWSDVSLIRDRQISRNTCSGLRMFLPTELSMASENPAFEWPAPQLKSPF